MKKYLSETLKSPQSVAKYLYYFKTCWVGNNVKKSWTFEESIFDNYISQKDAYDRITGMKNTDEFSKLDFKFKEIAVAFALWYESNENDRQDISNDKVDADIYKWESDRAI